MSYEDMWSSKSYEELLDMTEAAYESGDEKEGIRIFQFTVSRFPGRFSRDLINATIRNWRSPAFRNDVKAVLLGRRVDRP